MERQERIDPDEVAKALGAERIGHLGSRSPVARMAVPKELVDEFSRRHSRDRILQAIAEEGIEAAQSAMRMLRGSKGETKEHLLEELADVALMTTIYLSLVGVSEDDFSDIVGKKAETIIQKIKGE
jgi:NTP pyrophosphatase (non-canonical NTP hydrolase)